MYQKSADNTYAGSLMNAIQNGESMISGTADDGTRCVFVQIPAKAIGIPDAEKGANLVYYSCQNPKVIELTAGQPLSFFGVRTKDNLYLANDRYPFSVEGYPVIFSIQQEMNQRAMEKVREYYDALDAPVIEGAADNPSFSNAVREVMLAGKKPDESFDEEKMLALYCPMATVSQAVAYLCGSDYGIFVRDYLDQRRDRLITVKRNQNTLMGLIEHPEQVMERWELALADTLLQTYLSTYVNAEFDVDGKKLVGQTKSRTILQHLCYRSPFDPQDFTAAFRWKASDLYSRPLTCRDISKILSGNTAYYDWKLDPADLYKGTAYYVARAKYIMGRKQA